MGSDHSNNAAPQVAGIILQLERALYHLATAQRDDTIAVEHVDDVSVHRNCRPHLQEQDKHSVQKGGTVLGDRTRALWRTLQIWVDQFEERGSACTRYLLVSNVTADGKVAAAIRAIGEGRGTAAEAVAILREVGKPRRGKIQATVDAVLARSDATLTELLQRVELVERTDWSSARPVIANALGMDPGLDRELIVSALLGWLTETLVEAWRAGEAAFITREACLRQTHVVSRQLIRQRLLPRPSSEVVVSEAHRAQAHTRDFVARLTEINAHDEIIYEAVEHFLQFASERSRLAAEGDIPRLEWRDRGERLSQRWRGVARQARLEHPALSDEELGQLVLARTTFTHLEPLAAEPCQELYMTSGHYHRLADDRTVWWLPPHTPGPHAH